MKQSLLLYSKTHIWNTGSESCVSYLSHSGANVPVTDTLISQLTWRTRRDQNTVILYVYMWRAARSMGRVGRSVICVMYAVMHALAVLCTQQTISTTAIFSLLLMKINTSHEVRSENSLMWTIRRHTRDYRPSLRQETFLYSTARFGTNIAYGTAKQFKHQTVWHYALIIEWKQ